MINRRSSAQKFKQVEPCRSLFLHSSSGNVILEVSIECPLVVARWQLRSASFGTDLMSYFRVITSSYRRPEGREPVLALVTAAVAYLAFPRSSNNNIPHISAVLLLPHAGFQSRKIVFRTPEPLSRDVAPKTTLVAGEVNRHCLRRTLLGAVEVAGCTLTSGHGDHAGKI